jgi:DNA excision repair protein ERCC-2
MSATLRPIEPFQEAIGINAVPHFDELGEEIETVAVGETIRANGITDEMVATVETRPTAFDQFPLRFSPSNRLSLVADLPRFTQSNRGQPYDDDDNPVLNTEWMSDTREQYAKLIMQVVQTEGNILIGMPSYEEAAWAHDFIQTLSMEKRCLVDESTTADETEELLEEFFSDGAAILCTSLRGTITEGVDFDDDKLHTCLNIGVPLPPSDSRNKAVEKAYQQAIDSTSGREAAQRIPSTRKVRQSIGRVIRGTEEVGVRIVADQRYGSDEDVNLRHLLSPKQQREFTLIEPDEIGAAITRFWNQTR